MSTCLSNQLSLLMLLAVHGEVTTRELALSLGITERAVHQTRGFFRYVVS